jgi:nitroimidazol reductase NimA-like FMN-containing flavoprotein (pyridoxamine 5'-phosphate oxidase superfamily)
MRRQDKEIRSGDRLGRLLDEATVCRLGFCDGLQPYVVPMNFVRRGDDLYFHAARTGRKIDCIRRNPRVCFEVDRPGAVVSAETPCRWSQRYESVIGFGRAVLIDDPQEKGEALALLLAKHGGSPDVGIPEANLATVLVIRVGIESMTGKCSPPPADPVDNPSKSL